METADQRRGLQSYPPPSALLSFNRRPPTPPTIPAPPPSPVASFRAEAGVSMAPGSTVHEPVLGETPLWPEDSRPHSVAFCLPCINEVFLRHQSRPPQVFCKQFQSRGTHTLYGVTNTGIHLPVVSVGLCHRTQLVAAWTAPHVRFRDPSKSTRRREGGCHYCRRLSKPWLSSHSHLLCLSSRLTHASSFITLHLFVSYVSSHFF